MTWLTFFYLTSLRHYSRYRPNTLSKFNEFGHYQRLAPTSLLWKPPTYLSLLKERLPSIPKPPPWASDPSWVPPAFSNISLLTLEEQHKLRDAGRLCKQALQLATQCVKVGVTSNEVDEQVFNFVTQQGGYPSCLGYKGFPKSMCISVNNVLAHGIPDERPFKSSDLVTLDIALSYHGIHADCATTVALPNLDNLGRTFLDLTDQSYQSTVSSLHVHQPLNELASRFQTHLSPNQTVVPWLCGHGLGTHFHMAPVISPVPNPSCSVTLVPGMAFTFEPVVVQGTYIEAAKWLDGWTLVTQSGARSVQFEDTFLVTKEGVEMITMA
ncbi:hypothetical protein HMI54_013803 [Coelomomyces lativittatus]|nr:hypothetical protein HMI55_001881 [Coelomomyces lativittatus]KAJ1513995.1 hypothetical protein HMI56_001373 [Coelomomyces lativittatus]KAJ1514639.1 hypothetical protein HMI54_013803 [Coelomomyces lativittatus]